MIKKVIYKCRSEVSSLKLRLKAAGKQKVFCIGRNKTGTTSVERAFKDLGFPVGNQRKAEILYDQYYFSGNFDPIARYCKSAQVFQDVPFSCPETYKQMDCAYPGSKFILTVRDDADQWYRSITRFHAKKFGLDGRVPTYEDLKSADYVRPGYALNGMRVHGTSREDPYNEAILKAHYNTYNEEIIEYFKGRERDLLVINVSEEGAYRKFIDFLGVESSASDFPWENKT
jgi:hypothetical protein